MTQRNESKFGSSISHIIFVEYAFYRNAVLALFKIARNNKLVDGACLTITSAKAFINPLY